MEFRECNSLKGTESLSKCIVVSKENVKKGGVFWVFFVRFFFKKKQGLHTMQDLDISINKLCSKNAWITDGAKGGDFNCLFITITL